MGKSHYPIDLGVLTAIRQLVPRGSTIVELGSGSGTNRLVDEYSVHSVEDDEKWIGYCEGSNYIHAPLVSLGEDEEALNWYDPEVLRASLPDDYALVLVDGPAGEKGRDGLLMHLELFRTDVPFVIDDTLREHECRIAREMAYLLNRPLYVFWNFSVIAVEALPAEKIARIQRAALQILENEESPYLESHFTRITPITPIDSDNWKEKADSFGSNRLRAASLEASERRLRIVESSWAYRIGRLITLPLWPIHRLRVALRKRGK